MTKEMVDTKFYDSLVEKLSGILSSETADLETKKSVILSLLTTAKKGKRKKNIDLFFVHFCIATLCFLIRNSQNTIEEQYGPIIGSTFITHLFAISVSLTKQGNDTPFIHQLAGALLGISLTTFSTHAKIDDVFVFAYEILTELYLKTVPNKLDCLIDMLLCSLVQYEQATNQLTKAVNRIVNETAQQNNKIEKALDESNISTIKKTDDGHTIQ